MAGPPAAPPGSAARRPTPSGQRPPTRNGPPALRPAPTPRLAPGPPARPPTGPAPPHPGTPPRAVGLPVGLRIPVRPPLSTCRDRPARPAKAGLAARLRILGATGAFDVPGSSAAGQPDAPRGRRSSWRGDEDSGSIADWLGSAQDPGAATASGRRSAAASPSEWPGADGGRPGGPAQDFGATDFGATAASMSLARLRTVSPTLPAAGVPRGGGQTRTAAPLLTGSARPRTRVRPVLPAVALRLPHPASGLAPMVAGRAIRLRISARPGPSMSLARLRTVSPTLPVAGVLRGGGTRTVAPLLTGSARLRTQARPTLSISPARPAGAGLAPMVAVAIRLRALAGLLPLTSLACLRLVSLTLPVGGVLRGGRPRTVAPLLTGSAQLRTQARPSPPMSSGSPGEGWPGADGGQLGGPAQDFGATGPSMSPARLPALRVAGVPRGGRPRPMIPRPPRRRPAGLAPMAARLGTLTRLPPLTSLARLRTVSPTLPVAGVPRGGGTRTAAPLPTGSARLRTQARPPLSMSPARPAARLRTSARPRPASLTPRVAGVLRGVRPRTVAP